MSDSPRSGQQVTSEPTGNRAPRRAASDSSRIALVVVGIIALVALGLSSWALFRPAKSATSADATQPIESTSYTAEQQAAAKAKICAAHGLVRDGVTLNTNLQAPGGPDNAVGTLAVAANGRVALLGGGQYLLANLDPATPQQVADAVRPFALKLMDIGAAATAGIPVTDPVQSARLKDADGMNTTIANLCK